MMRGGRVFCFNLGRQPARVDRLGAARELLGEISNVREPNDLPSFKNSERHEKMVKANWSDLLALDLPTSGASSRL
jgi:hypothetical protein